MPQYKAPLRDMQFVLHELLNAEAHYAKLPAFQGTVSRELVDQYLEAAADFCENELSPINQSGDREGCTWNDGVVTTPTGFKEAYQKYIELGTEFVAVGVDTSVLMNSLRDLLGKYKKDINVINPTSGY